jgi:hypothetical protein
VAHAGQVRVGHPLAGALALRLDELLYPLWVQIHGLLRAKGADPELRRAVEANLRSWKIRRPIRRAKRAFRDLRRIFLGGAME